MDFEACKSYAIRVAAREGIICTFDWRYHSTARYLGDDLRTIRIGLKRLRAAEDLGWVPEWSRGKSLCEQLTGQSVEKRIKWIILHELVHAKLHAMNYRDAHNKSFYAELAKLASRHL